jgi:outer membrane protein assembly complex protein YaeT
LPLRHRSAGRVGAVAALLLIALLAPATVRAEGELPSELETVKQVHFKGRHRVAEHELRAALKTRGASILPWRERPLLRLDFVRADTLALANVYRQHGFLDVRVGYDIQLTSDKRRAVVTYRIDEGPLSRVHDVTFDGVGTYPLPALRKKLYARPGRPFNPSFLAADTARISQAYQERGYRPQVGAEATREGLQVHVRYDVFEGPSYRFGQVLLSSPGELHVRRQLIDRELLIKPGDLYRLSRINRSLEHLYETGLFSEVQITPLPVDSTIEIDMRVRERKTRWIDAGIGSGTYERLSVNADWGHRNVAGQGLQGSVGSKLSFDGNAKFLLTRTEASLLEPWLLRTRTRGQVTVYYEVHDDRASDPRWVVHQNAPGITFQLRREYGRYVRASLTQDNVFVKQSIDFTSGTIDQVTRDSLLRNVPPSYTTHRLTLAFDRDLRDDPLNPAHGSVQGVSGEIAGGPLKGSSSYTKTQFSSAWYTPVGTWVLASRVRAGVIRPFGRANQFTPEDTLVTDADVARVPLENRFRLGGVNSVRGFDENSLPRSGGLALVQANVELRIPLAGPFGVEAYVDAGNVWARPSYIKARHFVPRGGDALPDAGDVQYVFGFGPRVNLPFGPLRLDVTWSARPVDPLVRRWLVHELQFAIGPSF